MYSSQSIETQKKRHIELFPMEVLIMRTFVYGCNYDSTFYFNNNSNNQQEKNEEEKCSIEKVPVLISFQFQPRRVDNCKH